MPKFLLDANISPRVAKHLTQQLALHIVTLHGQGLGELPDHQAIELARHQHRVIITLDRDFSFYFHHSRQEPFGMIWLDLPSRLRYIPRINQLLVRFFRGQADSIDREQSLVVKEPPQSSADAAARVGPCFVSLPQRGSHLTKGTEGF